VERHPLSVPAPKGGSCRDLLTPIPDLAALHAAFAPGPSPDPERPLSVLFADLDRFGEVNRRHGRAAGDHVIAAVATRIDDIVRRADIAFRLSADEFVIATHDDCAATDALARRLVRAVAEPFDLPGALAPADGARVEISVSVGTVRSDGVRSASALEDLVYAAGSTMYIAKDRGPGGIAHRPHDGCRLTGTSRWSGRLPRFEVEAGPRADVPGG